MSFLALQLQCHGHPYGMDSDASRSTNALPRRLGDDEGDSLHHDLLHWSLNRSFPALLTSSWHQDLCKNYILYLALFFFFFLSFFYKLHIKNANFLSIKSVKDIGRKWMSVAGRRCVNSFFFTQVSLPYWLIGFIILVFSFIYNFYATKFIRVRYCINVFVLLFFYTCSLMFFKVMTEVYSLF